jgi:hypothetical protein
VKFNVPVPVPDALGVNVTKAAVAVAVHVQPVPAVTVTVTEPVPPSGPKAVVVGCPTLKVHEADVEVEAELFLQAVANNPTARQTIAACVKERRAFMGAPSQAVEEYTRMPGS